MKKSLSNVLAQLSRFGTEGYSTAAVITAMVMGADAPVKVEPLVRGCGLWTAVQQTTRSALARGALKPIQTEQIIVDDGGVRFLVRVVLSLGRKDADRRQRAEQKETAVKLANPFLPPEPELAVAGISPAHVAVLNKFNVLDHHLLIVTRLFEHQETLLTLADFRALFACMSQYPSLGFYNGGTIAGASSR